MIFVLLAASAAIGAWWFFWSPGAPRVSAGVVSVHGARAIIDLRKWDDAAFSTIDGSFERVAADLARVAGETAVRVWVIPVARFTAPGQLPPFLEALSRRMEWRATTNELVLTGSGPGIDVLRFATRQLAATLREVAADDAVS